MGTIRTGFDPSRDLFKQRGRNAKKGRKKVKKASTKNKRRS